MIDDTITVLSKIDFEDGKVDLAVKQFDEAIFLCYHKKFDNYYLSSIGCTEPDRTLKSNATDGFVYYIQGDREVLPINHDFVIYRIQTIHDGLSKIVEKEVQFPHPSHKMTDWKSSLVVHSSGSSRFGKIRECEFCEGEEIESIGGKECHEILKDPCPFRDRLPIEQCSHILTTQVFKGELKKHLKKMQAFMPFRMAESDGQIMFVYDGVCDGNTAHHLKQVIENFILLYRETV